jgi:hypothetical protein
MMLSALVASAALLLVGAGGAQAKVVELTGSTTFTPSQQASRFLANHGVTVAPVEPATAAEGDFSFPIAAGFGIPRRFNGLLAHTGGLQFTKGERSAVIQNFVAVRLRGHAVLLAQVPGLRGGCWRLARALDRVPEAHPLHGSPLPPPLRRYKQAIRGYCSTGRVIVLAKLTNLAKESAYNGALLKADLELGRQAARLINRLAQQKVVSAGARLGTAESRVSVVRDD